MSSGMRQPINSQKWVLMPIFTLVKSAALSAPDLSLSPCGERFGEGEVPLLGKRGRGVVNDGTLEWLPQHLS